MCSDGLHIFCEDEFQLTRKQAVEKAESMRIKRIKSLKKQIEKLEKLTFDK